MNKTRRRLKAKASLKVANLDSGTWQTWDIEISNQELRQLKGILNRSKVLFPYRSEKLAKYLKVSKGPKDSRTTP